MVSVSTAFLVVAHASKYCQALLQNQICKYKTKTWAVIASPKYQVLIPFPRVNPKEGLDIINRTHLCSFPGKTNVFAVPHYS